MDDKNINIEELLVRILENRAGSEEIRYFSKWMEGQENRVYFEKFKKILSAKKLYLVQKAEMRFHRELLKGMRHNGDKGKAPKPQPGKK